MTFRRVPVLLVAFALAGLPSAEAADAVDYARQIKPILRAHCYRCHGARKQEAGLRLDTARAGRAGGENGKVITPGKSAASDLIARVTAEDASERMPAEGSPLTAREVSLLKAWIDQGASGPDGEVPESDPRDHWAFRVPVQPPLPRPRDAAWGENPVDAFIARAHEQHQLVRQLQAPPEVLLRRVSLDLVGLPPTPAELDAFQADTAPGAWQRVVDRLLASPRYGERWGRHWMDVWRYSDWYGYQKELRNSARHIWRWRDWIVESTNDDLGYDRMISLMLAADELPDATPDDLRATGFLARNYYKFNRDTWLDWTIEHTGKAFLGLTLNCARCHDHMFDPIAQREYYQFRAIFEPHQVRTDPVAGELNPESEGVAVVFDAKLDVPTYLFERGNDKRPDKQNPLAPTVPGFLSAKRFVVEPVKLSAEVYYPGLREPVRRALLAAARVELERRHVEFEKLQQALEKANSKPAPADGRDDNQRAADVAGKQRDAAAARIADLEARIAADDARYRGQDKASIERLARAAARSFRQAELIKAEADLADSEFKLAKTGDKTKKQAATKVRDAANKKLATAREQAAKDDASYPPLTKTYPATSTGRRLALARWITSPDNPLVARVCVNHIWLRHFGSPLVPSVFDFGNNGKPPTHPGLLDWLAVELVESGWSMKHLHRLIVGSAAYRLHSTLAGADPITRRADIDNIWLWRMNSRRLESEAIRDSVLWVTGGLDERLGGPELDAALGMTTGRRSLYYRHAPEKMMTFLDLFDAASTNECYRRNETVVPQQALALVNSRLAIEQSRRLAAELTRAAGGDEADPGTGRFLDLAFRRILGRLPTGEETATCRQFLVDQARRLAGSAKLTPLGRGAKLTVPPSNDPDRRARENLVHVLVNHNEFLTIR